MESTRGSDRIALLMTCHHRCVKHDEASADHEEMALDLKATDAEKWPRISAHTLQRLSSMREWWKKVVGRCQAHIWVPGQRSEASSYHKGLRQ